MLNRSLPGEPILIWLPESLAPTCVHNNIRIGSDADGGYEIDSEAMMQADFLLSYGLSEDWRFEKQFLQHNKVKLNVYDHTVTKFWLVQNALRNTVKFLIGKYRFKNLVLSLWAIATYDLFFRNENKVHYLEKIVGEKAAPNEISLLETFQRIPYEKVFLKIDIEGSEFRILEQILSVQHRIIALAIEFHDLDLFEANFLAFVTEMQRNFQLNSININNFACVPPSGSPRVVEVCMSKCNCEELHNRKRIDEIACTPNNEMGPRILIGFGKEV